MGASGAQKHNPYTVWQEKNSQLETGKLPSRGRGVALVVVGIKLIYIYIDGSWYYVYIVSFVLEMEPSLNWRSSYTIKSRIYNLSLNVIIILYVLWILFIEQV